MITDWEMPRMTGIQLCEAIRSGGQEGYIYIILLTSHGTTAECASWDLGRERTISLPSRLSRVSSCARVQAAERILSMETRDVAIFAMAKLAESRDPETGDHLERVMNYSRILAKQLLTMGHCTREIDAEFVRAIYATSPLHDIGKVGIPDYVLLKPGRLSDREFEIMKRHTVIGAETLDAALKRFPGTRFLQMRGALRCRIMSGSMGKVIRRNWRGNRFP